MLLLTLDTILPPPTTLIAISIQLLKPVQHKGTIQAKKANDSGGAAPWRGDPVKNEVLLELCAKMGTCAGHIMIRL